MFPPLKNDRLIRALLREPVDVTPVWIMRQAGRYLPEYRETRRKAGSFLKLCKTPELACEVTMQPLARFPLDAAILFSDILTIPDAMGLGLYFADGEGPKFEQPVRTVADVDRLGVLDPADELGYVTDAVSLIRHELDGRVPLIGFSGSPWTLATYMIEGGSSRDFVRIKQMLYAQPAALGKLLDILSDSVSAYLNAQVRAGAQALMIFDTWGGVLSGPHYRQFSLDPMERILSQLERISPDGQKVPVILYTKGGAQWLDTMADSGADALGLDWTVEISAARKLVGERVALQGNLDPSVLFAPPETIRESVAAVLRGFGAGEGHVFNLGHGIHQQVNPEHLSVLVDAVHELSAANHTL